MKFGIYAIMVMLISSGVYGQEPSRVILVYGDRENGMEFSEVLHDAGMTCELLEQSQASKDWEPSADLLVFLSCCKGGYCRGSSRNAAFLDKLGESRILACGNSGAALLATKELLIGHPNGWHKRSQPKILNFPPEIVDSPMGQILRTPHKLIDYTGDDASIAIHDGDGELEEVQIYDGGRFPAGTTGIGGNGRHHWTICKQGNYTLWGADSRGDNLTDEGKNLFANLCWYLAHAAPENLRFPEKHQIEVGTHDGILVGGGRDKYYHHIKREGTLRITLQWDLRVSEWNRNGSSMMMMTHGPVTKRVDGASPLEIMLETSRAMVGRQLQVNVGSFSLREGENCPYQLAIEGQSNALHAVVDSLDATKEEIQRSDSASTKSVQVVRKAVYPQNKKTYALLRSNPPTMGLSWTEAERAAKELGGHLVVVNSREEHEWLSEAFTPSAGFDNYVWIGLSDAEEEGVFTWTNGDPLEFEAWYRGEPNDSYGGEDYVLIYNWNSKWNDMRDRPKVVDKHPISAVVEISSGSGIVPQSVTVIGSGTTARYNSVRSKHDEAQRAQKERAELREKLLEYLRTEKSPSEESL